MRYVYIVVGALVALVVLITVIGWVLPVRHKASVARTYRASAPALFGLITDVASFPSWRSEVTQVEMVPDDNGHKRWKEMVNNGPPITYMVEQSIPDRLLVGRITDRNLPFGGSWTYELTPADDGSTTLRITEDGEVYNPIFRFVSRFVMGHDATMKQYLSAVGTRFAEVPADVSPR
jgi:uncharacterized protein YndB with AHSA1/START domain